MYREAKIANQPIFFNFKSSLLYIWCIYVAIYCYKCFFLQVGNLNLATNLENYYFCVMLIVCKYTPLCKKLDCDFKSESPYLAITLWHLLHGQDIHKMVTCEMLRPCGCSPYNMSQGLRVHLSILHLYDFGKLSQKLYALKCNAINWKTIMLVNFHFIYFYVIPNCFIGHLVNTK